MTEALETEWFDPDSTTFGDRVAGAREAAGMTQKQLSKRLGVKLSTLEAWENDMSEPRANKLQMMAGLLNVSLGWLLEGTGEGVSNPAEETAPDSNADMREILLELRELKTRANKTANRLGALEKRLRALGRENGIG